jgi:exosortase
LQREVGRTGVRDANCRPAEAMDSPMTLDVKKLSAAALILVGIAVVYWRVMGRLVEDWIVDGNYSHGWLIVPLAGYFVWERRAKLAATAIRSSWFGLVVLAGSMLVLLAGLYGSELFLTRVSLVGTAAGIVLYLFGWGHLRILAFPIGFLLLMIPLPAIVFNKIAFPLQLFASRVGEATISAANIPVLREGNVLVLANTQLEVAEACSGIRSLVSLLTLGIVYGYFSDSRTWVRCLIVASTIPIAILANGARVAGTGIAAHYFGPAAAEGFFHEFSGWALFVVAFVMMLIVQKIILRFAPAAPTVHVQQPAAAV